MKYFNENHMENQSERAALSYVLREDVAAFGGGNRYKLSDWVMAAGLYAPYLESRRVFNVENTKLWEKHLSPAGIEIRYRVVERGNGYKATDYFIVLPEDWQGASEQEGVSVPEAWITQNLASDISTRMWEFAKSPA